MKRLCFVVLAAGLIGCESMTGPGDTGFTPIARCDGGIAGGFACRNVDMISHLPLPDLEDAPNGSRVNDIWGWSDSQSGRDYALVGRSNGVNIIDITDARNPRAVARLPSHVGSSTWRDIKVYRNHAYVVADGIPGHGMQVLDLTRLRDADGYQTFQADVRYDGVGAVHNIAINEETGFAYAVGTNAAGETCGGGLHMIDIRSPLSPTFAGCFARAGTGRAGTGYTHDVQCVVYHGPDGEYDGREICMASNETDIVIVDVTEKSAPRFLSRASYPGAGYVHQGWLTEDHAYFLQNDELDELTGTVAATRLLVWDVSDLDDPVLARQHTGPTIAVDHNIYVRGNVAYYSNYTFGLRILGISNPERPVELGYFDTHPPTDASNSFSGSWSNYPFFDSNVIAVSSSDEGLFLLQR